MLLQEETLKGAIVGGKGGSVLTQPPWARCYAGVCAELIVTGHKAVYH